MKSSRSVLSDYEQRMLLEGGFFLSPLEPGVETPSERTRRENEHVKDTGFTLEEVARRLCVTVEEVRARLEARTVYGVLDKAGSIRFPRFQFVGEDGGLVSGISEVLAVLPQDLEPIEVQDWFSYENQELLGDKGPISPLAWLNSGCNPLEVIDLARELDCPCF